MVDFKDFNKLRWYYQVAIVAAVCGGLLALVWYQYLSPIEEDIKARNNDYAALQLQIAKSMKQAAAFEELKKQTVELQMELDSLKKILPLEKETDQILRQAQ